MFSSAGMASSFSASTGRSSLTPPPPVSTSSSSSGSGLLQEFRKKTMQKIVKYASPATSTASSPITSPRTASSLDSRRGALLSPRTGKEANGKKGLSDLTHRIERFEEHDALLRQLEIELGDMLTQINTACRAMGTVVEVFTQSFRYDSASYKVGVDYLAIMKQMRRERAHLMDQAIRFTVLDPLSSRLARHDALHQRIAEWKQLRSELDKEERKKWSDQGGKEARLAGLRELLDPLERELGEDLENATSATAVRQQMDFFTTMRLQLATFFYHTNYSLFSRLSETETEIVIGVGPSARSPVAGAIATRVTKPPHQPEDDDECDHTGDHETVSSRDSKTTISGSNFSDELSAVAEDEPLDDEEPRGSITLEDFEQGKPLPLSPKSSMLEPAELAIAKVVPLPELLALASNPVVDTPHVDLDEHTWRSRTSRSSVDAKRHVASTPSTASKSDGESSMFSSIRKSFNEKFNTPKGTDKLAATPPISPTSAMAISAATARPKPPRQRRPVLTPHEWLRVERVLWSLDTTASQPDSSEPCVGCTLQQLLTVDSVLHAVGGFLDLISIARLAKTNHSLHHRIRHCPAVWKRSIRDGSLTKSTRSAVWLGVLYGSAPWSVETNSSLPHHLKARESRNKMYEGLLIKLGARIADGLLQKSFDEDSDDVDTSRLVVWLREIDVDVVRTCSRAIYAVQNGTPAEALGCYRALLEGTIRRVLRAYVMYNPRVGYCQGMNFLVRLLMEVCGGEADEADCFWLFVGLCEPENDRNLYEPGLAVLQPLFSRFEEQLAQHKPQLHAHLQREGVPVAAYTARWFLTFFSTCETFDASIVIRLLDVFVIDGWRIMFGMALVVLDELEAQLLEADMEEMLRMLQAPRSHMGEFSSVEEMLRRGLAYSIPPRC